MPRLELFAETVYMDRGTWAEDLEEVRAPLLRLSFVYPDARQPVAAHDPRASVLVAARGGPRGRPRDLEAEARARTLLESLGAVDVECAPDVGVPPDVEAHYLVRPGGDVHEHCHFSAWALPQLERLGWQVHVAPDYPFRVAPRARFVVDVAEADERPDWFAVELGVAVAGRRISLLPALLGVLDEGSEGDSLRSLARGREQFVLPFDDGLHVAVQRDLFQALLHVVVELYEGAEDAQIDRLLCTAEKAPALVALDEAFTKSEVRHEWNDEVGARELGARLSTRPDGCDGPAELQATLRPYQREGLAWLQHLRASDVGGVLADDMGLGKTLQTIAHLATEKAEGRLADPAIVVAPTSLVGNWKRELAKFAPFLDVLVYHGPQRAKVAGELGGVDVVVTSYPILVRDQELLTDFRWHLAILDEAQTIKNHRSRSHVACKALEAKHRVCLSGTPVENHLGELWALFDFVNPGLLGSEAFFRRWYRTPVERFGDEERLLALHAQVSPFILRRTKQGVAKELPPKTCVLRPVDIEGKQRELYEAIRVAAHAKVRGTIAKKGLAASTIPILDALLKLRQLCCDPRLVKMQAARFVQESAKTRAFFELLERQLPQGRRLLVFSQFTSMLGLLESGCRERGIRTLKLTGQSKNRQGLCDRFEAGEADVFLLSLKAAGTGLNLVSADTVVHFDPWWNPQAQAQATDRAYRIGQTKPVFVYELFVAGSVEERILALQRRKQRLADAILRGELPQGAGLTEEDVDLLLAPLG